MQKAPGPRLQYRRIYRLPAPCLRGSSCVLHNRRPVDVFFPELDKISLPVAYGSAWLPEVTRYHRLVKRKWCLLLRHHQYAIGGAQGIAELDKAIWSLSRYVHDSERRE